MTIQRITGKHCLLCALAYNRAEKIIADVDTIPITPIEAEYIHQHHFGNQENPYQEYLRAKAKAQPRANGRFTTKGQNHG